MLPWRALTLYFFSTAGGHQARLAPAGGCAWSRWGASRGPAPPGVLAQTVVGADDADCDRRGPCGRDGQGRGAPLSRVGIFFTPVFLAGACTYFILPFDVFVVQIFACAASFYAHVFFDKEYHVEGSRLQRFAWFRRKQELHFVHHRHANSNFAVIHFFWDRFFGTYRNSSAAPRPKPIARAAERA